MVLWQSYKFVAAAAKKQYLWRNMGHIPNDEGPRPFIESLGQYSLAKLRDDNSLVCSPCRHCGHKLLPWGFEYCPACGNENEDFEEEYMEGVANCPAFHKEFLEDFAQSSDASKDQTRRIYSYCADCGEKLL